MKKHLHILVFFILSVFSFAEAKDTIKIIGLSKTVPIYSKVKKITSIVTKEDTTIRVVSFKNKGLKLAGHLHLPANFDETKKYPALVGIHPFGGVKEQVVGLYAKKMAEHGFVVLVYDSSYQGESEGEPRLLEDPAVRIEDARCAADYLTTLPLIDTDRMSVYGVCAGGGYALGVAETEHRFKTVMTVSEAPMGDAQRFSPIEEQVKTLEMAAKQRTVEANGGAPVYLPIIPEKFEDINEKTPDLMREGYDYYRTSRGQYPTSKGRYLLTSMDKIYAFSIYDHLADYLTQPMLVIAGSKADTRFFSEKAYELSKGPKELFIVEGATHIAMYDTPKYVNQAIDKMVEFLNKYMPE